MSGLVGRVGLGIQQTYSEHHIIDLGGDSQYSIQMNCQFTPDILETSIAYHQPEITADLRQGWNVLSSRIETLDMISGLCNRTNSMNRVITHVNTARRNFRGTYWISVMDLDEVSPLDGTLSLLVTYIRYT